MIIEIPIPHRQARIFPVNSTPLTGGNLYSSNSKHLPVPNDFHHSQHGWLYTYYKSSIYSTIVIESEY